MYLGLDGYESREVQYDNFTAFTIKDLFNVAMTPYKRLPECR